MIRITGYSFDEPITLLYSPVGVRQEMRYLSHVARLPRRLCAIFHGYAPMMYADRSDMKRLYPPPAPDEFGKSIFAEMFNSIRDVPAMYANRIMEIRGRPGLKTTKPWYRHRERW